MFVGHAFVAFAIGATGAVRLGASRRRALLFGVTAAAFATVPDVDVLVAVLGLLRAGPDGVWAATAAFWAASQAVHRAVTHSLLLALPAAGGFALAAGRRFRPVAAVPLAGLVAIGWLAEGPLAAAMLGLFALAGLAVARLAAGHGLGRRAVLAAALLGLLSHPFGDLFTGTPPSLFYPLEAAVVGERVTLLADPTLNLLGVFGLELAAIWLGVAVAARFAGWSLATAIDRRAAAGALYGVAAFLLPPPTLETSYHFVFSVLAVGSVGAAPLSRRIDRERAARAAVTGLAGVSLAGAAYAAVYALA
ncbi:MAG: metal-dependent hydrolase [Halobacteriales archaeon]